MSLDCREFDQVLEALVEGRLARGVSVAVRAHLERCDRCRELLALAEAPESSPVDLAPAVLARTSGPSCGRAREMLGDVPSGSLSPLDAALVRSHLSGCTECAGLAGVVSELTRDLPLLAEIDPGEAFTRAVLARTGAPRGVAGRGAAWLAAWRQIVLRPRFALEAAYVLTAVVLIVFGVPSAPVAGFSRQVREVAALELPGRLEGTIRATGERLRSHAEGAWRRSAAPVALDARRSVVAVASRSRETLDELRAEFGTLWARVASEPTNEEERSAGGGHPKDGGER